MTAIGLYFRGLDREETNALRARLNKHAAFHGYTATRGPTAGQGNLAEMLQAIDAGELATVLLADSQFTSALAHLDVINAEWAQSIAAGLRRALEYQAEAEANDDAEWID